MLVVFEKTLWALQCSQETRTTAWELFVSSTRGYAIQFSTTCYFISTQPNPTFLPKPTGNQNLLLRAVVAGHLAEVVPLKVFNLDRMFAYTIRTLLNSWQWRSQMQYQADRGSPEERTWVPSADIMDLCCVELFRYLNPDHSPSCPGVIHLWNEGQAVFCFVFTYFLPWSHFACILLFEFLRWSLNASASLGRLCMSHVNFPVTTGNR